MKTNAEAWIDLIQLARYQEKPEKRLLKNGRTISEFTINLGGNKVVFIVHRLHEGGSDFLVTHDDEVICDGYQSDRRFYFLSMSKKVEFFQEVFEAKVMKSLKVLFK